MPTRPRPHCNYPGCPDYATVGGQCARHSGEAERRRGSASERGYNSRHWKSTRRTVLRRDPWCRCGPECCEDGCWDVSEVADHFPKDRKQLIAEGVSDPDHPSFCRGLSKRCHSKETARLQPGGWNAR